jgi:hypothetical protein
MPTRWKLLATGLLLAVLAAGCGTRKAVEPEYSAPAETAVPAPPEVEPPAAAPEPVAPAPAAPEPPRAVAAESQAPEPEAMPGKTVPPPAPAKPAAPAPSPAPPKVAAATPAASEPAPAPAPAPLPAKPVVPPTTPAKPAEPTLDLNALKERLKETDAIGVMTKLTLKNQVDDLMKQFRSHYKVRPPPDIGPLRQTYNMLVMKVLTLVQDGDPSLARTISASREAIWGMLADPVKFNTLL